MREESTHPGFPETQDLHEGEPRKMEGLSGIIVPLKKGDFQRFYDSLYLYKIDYKNYTFLHKEMKQTLKVWRLTEFNCIRLHATLGWLRLGSGLWLGRAGLSSSGARMMVGDKLLMDEHDNHSMVIETYLQDTLSARFKTSQKATSTGFTPALTYSKLQLIFSFFEENKKD